MVSECSLEQAGDLSNGNTYCCYQWTGIDTVPECQAPGSLRIPMIWLPRIQGRSVPPLSRVCGPGLAS